MEKPLPLCSRILGELLISLKGADVPLPGNIASDSRKAAGGGVFAAVPGTKADGHDFIAQAGEQAAVIVHSRPLASYRPDRSYYLVKDASAAAALLFREKYGRPDEKLQLLGVTGTNGKTTTVFVLEHLLERCGLLSTVEFRTGAETLPATHTTPDPETLFRLLAEMHGNALQYAAMELSSHALAQKRAYGAGFKAAVFTNLTGDHLDYHKDMESYYQAKKLFFTELLAPDGAAVINTDDPGGARLASELEGVRRVVSFGMNEKALWQIRNLKVRRDGNFFELVCGEKTYPVISNLAGRYNAFNLTGALLAALETGADMQTLLASLKNPVTVPGRMQFFSAPGKPLAVVDFAHTDDALVNVLSALRPLTAGRLFCVFGAGGNRDRSKRPRMGKAASCADHLIVTSDNPRDEEPGKIIEEIVSGIPCGISYETETDRKKAIEKALSLAGEKDVVLIAGKGHETYQEIRGVKYPFSDAEIIQQYFKEVLK